VTVLNAARKVAVAAALYPLFAPRARTLGGPANGPIECECVEWRNLTARYRGDCPRCIRGALRG